MRKVKYRPTGNSSPPAPPKEDSLIDCNDLRYLYRVPFCSSPKFPGVIGVFLLVAEHGFSEREQAADAADAAKRPEEQQSARAAHRAAACAGAEQQSLPLHTCGSREAHGQHVPTREARAGVPECTGQGGGAGQASQPRAPAQRRGGSGARGGSVVLQLRDLHEEGLAVALAPPGVTKSSHCLAGSF